MSEPKQCCGCRHFTTSVMGTINSHTRQTRLNPPHGSGNQQCCRHRHLPCIVNTVKPPTCLWASTVWQAPMSAIPEEDDATSHMPLGINNMVGTDVCHTRRRRRNLPHSSDINMNLAARSLAISSPMALRLSSSKRHRRCLVGFEPRMRRSVCSVISRGMPGMS